MRSEEQLLQIQADSDILQARVFAGTLAEHAGFTGSDVVLIAAAVSEAARSILKYAKHGEILLSASEEGLLASAHYSAASLTDPRAIEESYARWKKPVERPGLRRRGPAARIDDFVITSEVGTGVAVKLRWLLPVRSERS